MTKLSLDASTPWTKSWKDVAQRLEVSIDQGLDPQEVEQRRERYGPNRLRSAGRKSAWQILLEQFKSLIVGLLAVAAVLSFAFGDWVEGIAVVVVILINALIGFVTEYRAVRSMEALQELGSVDAKVRRQGQPHQVSAEALVPGDVVLVDGGDVVTADLRLVEASKLQANESALTGESVPVSKQVDSLEEDVPLAERANMLFKGTAVTRGTGEGIVVATGMETELGQISSLVQEAEEEVTPLEQRLDQLGHNLIWVTLSLAAVVAISGILSIDDRDGHRVGRGEYSRGIAHRRDCGAGAGNAPHGATQRADQSFVCRGDAGGDEHHPHRQDRHVDGKSDDGQPDRIGLWTL